MVDAASERMATKLALTDYLEDKTRKDSGVKEGLRVKKGLR